MKVLGAMSGTSVDGVDYVLVELAGQPPTLEWELIRHREILFPSELREGLIQALKSNLKTRELALLHHNLGRFYAQAAQEFVGVAELAAIHGQTVWHEPPAATLQIGEPSYLANALGVPVASDFRPADLALGGEAAPLVPYPDLLLYGEAGAKRAIHNIGGISNLTYLDGLDPAKVVAFDTGPGNCLMDEAASRLGLTHDPGGSLAAKGNVDGYKLGRWLEHPFFMRKPPKSTGREVWNLESMETEGFRPNDLLATLSQLTVQSIVQAYQNFVLPLGLDEVWVAGGGAYNQTLVNQFKAALNVPVYTFEEKGHDSKVREALCFAVLGYLRYMGLPNVLKQVTGASKNAVAGKICLPGQ